MKMMKRILSMLMAVIMILSCWVWIAPEQSIASAATDTLKDHYLFAYFTGTSQEGQTIHLAVSKDGLNYTALRNNEPVIIPSKGVGCVRDPYIWYNEQDNYYYILATDLDFTDNGGTYSENGEGFIIWRSKDLVHWYDETMINIVEMSHLIGETTNMTSVWAPQVLWDGESYVVYFTLRCDATYNGSYNVLMPVYLRTTNLLDQDAYYEYGVLFDRNLHSIDTDIIQNPANGKWYLFYKNEDNDLGTNDSGSALKTIHYLVSEGGPTGPYTINDYEYGTRVYPNVNINLEGCNSFFDNDGNLITYTDNYDSDVGTFYISKSTDFSTFTMLDSSQFNINTLSPRHGSVVKITEAEYNNLINNAYGVSASSFPSTEELTDHLVGRYFTNSDPTYNAANGKNDLSVTDIGMYSDYMPEKLGYYAFFNGSSSYAQIDLKNLIPHGLNYDDGFSITFTALVYGNSDSRFYSITNGSNTTNFAVSGSASGAYVVNNSTTHTTSTYLNDAALHNYIISYANGNIIIYEDGNLLLKKNRFNGATMDDTWYNAIGNGTLYIGALAANSGLLYGGISDFCIYDCSMSYYDAKTVQNELDIVDGTSLTQPTAYSTFTSAVPSWTASSTSDMASLAGTYFSNILYSPQVTGMPSGNGSEDCNPSTSNGAAVANSSDDVYYGVYYANNTVLFIDGVTTPKMPVYAAGRVNSYNRDGNLYQVYPIVSTSDTSDCKMFSLTNTWTGWHASSKYHESINNPDGITTGHNSSTSGSCDLDNSNGTSGNQGQRDIYYIANTLKLNEDQVSFNAYGYQKINLSWHFTIGWQKYSWGWKDWETRTDNLASSFNTWIVDLRPYVALRNTIMNEFNSIISNTTYCPAAIANYKAIVEEIHNFNPQAFNYAGGTETAVQACTAQIKKLQADYDYVKTQLGPCNDTTIYGKEPTCTANGMTDGHYCSICGEVQVEQELITKLAHSFGGQTTDDGVNYYVQCSVCGLKYLVENKEVRYGNLFSLTKFITTNSYAITSEEGTVSANILNDTLTIANKDSSGECMTNASNSTGRASSDNNYAIPVEGGETYYLEYLLTTTGVDTDVYIFCYDVNNACVEGTYGAYCSNSSGKSQLHTYSVTVPESTRYIELRFDVDTALGSATFANIGFYKADSYEIYSSQNPYSRLHFSTEDSIELFTPKRIGYNFLGWYTSDGRKIENTNQLITSDTVFPKWEELGNSVNYNGNLFSLTNFANTNDYKMQSSVPDAHVWADFSSGTLNTLSARADIVEGDRTEAQNLDTYNAPGSYKVAVTAGEEYVFTMTLANRDAYQCYLWFYNSSGGAVTHPATGAQWINHSTNKPDNGCVASWNNTTLIIRFTVPDGATQMSFRMGTTGKPAFTQTFSNIGLYSAEDYEIYKQMSGCPATTYVPNSETTDLATPTRDCFEFAGWNTGKFGTGTDFTSSNTTTMTADAKVYPKWKITDSALTIDKVVVDFGSPITFSPIENDTVANEEATFTGGNYQLVSVDSTDAQGTFSVSGNTVTYTPASAINGLEYVTYNATLSAYGMETTVSGELYVVPASNILYEEDVFTESSALSGNNWSETNSSATTGNQANSSATDIYGYDTSYLGNAGSFSGNSALTTTVNSTSKRSKIMTYSFLGTGYDLYGQCGPNTGVMIVTIKDSTGKAIKASVIDTYYNDAFGTLTQVPITGASDLAYDEYTVQVSSMYLASAGAVKATQTQSVMGFGDMVAYSAPLTGAQMLYEALAEVGMEDVFEADDLEVIWFDDDSVFNGGYGAYTLADAQSASTSTASAVTELTCVIDSIRVYNPAYYVGDDYYISSETGAQYYNIIDNLVSGDVVTGNALFTFVSGETNESVDKAAYQDKGSKNEFYLINDGTANALSFTIDPATLANKENAKIMISLRAASGTPKASINGNAFDVSSATEMYYDITEYVDANTGVVAIQNIGDGLLAIDNIKLTGNAAVSTFNLFATRRMMAMPVEEVEPNAPEETPSEPEIEDVPSVDEENTKPDADTSTDTSTATDEDSAINGLLDFINKLIEFILKIVRTIFAVFSI